MHAELGDFVPGRVAVLLFVLGLSTSIGTRAEGGTPLATVRVAWGLSNPVYVTHAPNDYERLFILEQRGRIRILKNGAVLPTPFLDIVPLVSMGGEQGLLGLAFHPDYASNRIFFVNYTNLEGDTIIAKFTASESDPDQANKEGDTIFFVNQPYPNHNGGWLDFGPDGYLYIGLGDGGNQADPNGYGQSLVGDLLGTVIRVDVNSDAFPSDPLRDYSIPPDNPFAQRSGEDEIWAFGLRNPWRCAFDRLTGDFWIADVGEGRWEEVNFQPASSRGGQNYGWNCREGTECTTFGECNCGSLVSVLPIHEYAHEAIGQPFRCSITGGVVYRGCEIPDLAGSYFFADFCSGQIWSMTYNGTVATVVERTAELAPASPWAISNPSSFGTDAAGEIYICDRQSLNGEVFKIVPATGAPRLISTDPPHRTIDARTPLAADGTTPVGVAQVTWYFDPPTQCVSPGAFFVTQNGVGGAPPTVSAVTPVANNGLQIRLSRPIEPKAWTTITHAPTLSTGSIGFLPGDVNSDQFSNPVDILALVDFLNGIGPALPLTSTDLDRSGIPAPADLIMLIDLLNGSGDLDSYLNAHLP